MAGLEPGQDGYGNEVDRAESGDQLSDEDESDENEITHAVPFKCISAAHEKNYKHHLEQAIFLFLLLLLLLLQYCLLPKGLFSR